MEGKQTQTTEKLQNTICEMVKKVDSEALLWRIYRFVQYIYIHAK